MLDKQKKFQDDDSLNESDISLSIEEYDVHGFKKKNMDEQA